MALTLPAPNYGYITLVDLGMQKAALSNGRVLWNDDGTSCDIRKLSGTWLLTTAQAEAVEQQIYGTPRELLHAVSFGAGAYPYGPDRGSGDTTSFCLGMGLTGRRFTPYRYHEAAGEFVLGSMPAYSIPAGTVEGVFSVGAVTGLQMPQDGFALTQDRPAPVVTRTGAVYASDIGGAGDHIISRVRATGSTANMARLLYGLTATIRGADFQIGGYNPFSPHAYGTCCLYNRQIEVIHHGYDRHEVSFEVVRQGVPS